MVYDWVKALHIISIIAWMAGMLYLPRLFVYHADAKVGSELSETLKIMERRLLRYIINPAMITSFVFGFWLLHLNPELLHQDFMKMKLFFVLMMTILHGCLARYRKVFARDENKHSARFYRIINETPTFFMIAIVLLVVVKPSF